MKNVLIFLLCLFGVILCALLLLLFVDTGSNSWREFSRWATIVKWLIVPAAILALPRIIERTTKKALAPSSRKLLVHSQVLMGALFVAIEVSHGVFQ
ncbi:hypothetical protein [Aeromonas sp. Y311-2]|jgi:hypothetical protein|uniref:hypothetical protein n=1 Tax=Aeromonas sp. Y311-2 TaxID=2990507 RepID=UPI0022E113E3|nr:hypothetical protein [Aeromonas sp. Y311-2]